MQELKDRVDQIERAGIAAPAAAPDDTDLRREVDARLRAEADERLDLVHALEGVRRRVEAIERRRGDTDDFVERSRALPYTTPGSFETFDVPEAGRVLGFRGRGEAAEHPYVAFEAVFREPEERIREAQRPYLPLLTGQAPVVDIGCGRGELLDLLRDAGVEASGVDADAGMVARCREKGHERVEQRDGVAFVEAREPGELGAVFSAQVVEHLPFEALERLLRAAHRALREGGVFVAETVNPHAPDALKAFWVDPTHFHPIFPETLLALCGAAGFTAAYAFHPGGTGDVEHDRFERPAYAVVATR